jgi:hypothetical protein
MRRRWRRRALWAAALLGLALLAVPATVAQATAAVNVYFERRPKVRKLIPLLVLGVLAVSVGTGAFASSSSVSRTMTLVAVDIPKSEVHVDAGAKGDSPGDAVFFRETILRDGRKAGGSEIMCVVVGRDAGRCSGTLRLQGGTLEASGGTHFGGRFSLPVVGGTGRYAGARGELTVVAVSEKRSRYEIELTE